MTMTTSNLDFGTAAKVIRKRSKLTQRAAAKRLGITAVHLCNVEGGHAVPSLVLCRRYYDTFGCDLYVASAALSKPPQSTKTKGARTTMRATAKPVHDIPQVVIDKDPPEWTLRKFERWFGKLSHGTRFEFRSKDGKGTILNIWQSDHPGYFHVELLSLTEGRTFTKRPLRKNAIPALPALMGFDLSTAVFKRLPQASRASRVAVQAKKGNPS